MKVKIGLIILAVMFAVLGFSAEGFPAGKASLETKDVTASEIKGTFSVIFFGGRYYDDFETIAFLDLEADRYTFEPYAPDFDFKIEKGLPAKEALAIAEEFVSQNSDFWRPLLSRILDYQGKTVGYEVRPLYMPLTFGTSDVLDVSYALKGDKVVIYIDLKQSVKRQLFLNGGERQDGGR
ncbi:MAG: hypothetical protein M1497_01860 [Nitrospirae bacterium]|nr:hypothetical protein [Nitrospirota bacterium]